MERGRGSYDKLEDVRRVMGMVGCVWLLKWGGGTAFARLSLESRHGLGPVKIKDPAGIDSALHRVDSQGLI
ncbi:hypothetical protein PIB30_057588 [Stylosanthes scabra]|uniref:Uncharacterized protein n=1 Tax=Stylosanthes scabra TaxID=79078 RepID=A0ABU6TJI2_9FABA|nr:hypothetical protein [Stylosanthes scabra]